MKQTLTEAITEAFRIDEASKNDVTIYVTDNKEYAKLNKELSSEISTLRSIKNIALDNKAKANGWLVDTTELVAVYGDNWLSYLQKTFKSLGKLTK